MIQYAILSPDGYPLQLGTAPALPEGATELPAGADLTRLARMRFTGGSWIDRPQPMAAVDHDAAGAAIVTVSGAAPGSRLVVIDVEWGEAIFTDTFDLAGQWRLPDPGSYSIEIETPLPWLPQVLRVEVPA